MNQTIATTAASESRPIPPETLRRLTERLDGPGLVRWLAHLALIAVTGWACWSGHSLEAWWYWPVALLHGAVLVTLFAPLHETIHYTAFASRWLNHHVAAVCGLVLLLPPQYFRAFHLDHHRYTQDLALDPELALLPPDSRLAYLWRVSGVPYWLERVATTIAVARGKALPAFVSQARRNAVIREARAYLLAYAALAAASIWAREAVLIWVWVIPALLGQPMLRLYLLAEHSGCEFSHDMLANSRTTRTNWLVRALFWNMPFHAEHHRYAAIPFHRLPDAHEVVRPRIEVLSPGYVDFHRRYWAGLGRSG